MCIFSLPCLTSPHRVLDEENKLTTHSMAQHTPTAVGTDAVRAAYERTFTAISPAVTFAVQEIVLISSEYAFARATAKGVIKAGGADHKAENQELFVLKKEGGEWKIARYCFSTMLPPSALGELHKSTW